MCRSTRARNSSGSTVSVPAVGPVRRGLGGAVVGQPLQRDGMPGAVAREAGGERAIVHGDPHGGVHVEPGMRPREHTRGLVFVEQRQAHEEPKHGATERLGQARGVVHRPRHDGPVWPEAAVGDEEVQVRMSVRPGAMRLQAGHDPHGEVALASQRANGGGDGAGGDAGDLAE